MNSCYVSTITKNGATTEYTYDNMGNMLTEKDGNGKTTSYQYDGLNNIKTITRPDGSTIEKEYNYSANTLIVKDENNHRIKYSYDKAGNITKAEHVEKKADSTIASLQNIISFEYDSEMRLSKEKSADEETCTEYGYDSYGDINLKKTYDIASGDILRLENISIGWTEEKTTIIGDGSSQSMVHSITKDLDGNITSENKFGELSAYTYNKAGHLKTEIRNNSFSIEYKCDFAGRITEMEEQTADKAKTVYTYDWLGRKTSENDPYSATSTFTYDDSDRLLSSKVPVENSKYMDTRYIYDKNGNLTDEIQNENSTCKKWTKYQYNQRNFLTKAFQIDTKGNAYYTEYTHDLMGNIKTATTGNKATVTSSKITYLTSPEKSKTEYAYNNLNQLKTMTMPTDLGTSETYTYDVNGNLKTKAAPGGTTEYGYDGLGRVKSETMGGKSRSFTYCATGGKSSETFDGVTTTYEYDSTGKAKLKLYSVGERRFKEFYSNDARGNLTDIKLWEDTGKNDKYETIVCMENYVYNSEHRLEKVNEIKYTNGQKVSETTVASYTYDKKGRLGTATYQNGITTTYGYNHLNQVASVSNTKGSSTLSSYVYTYSIDGNADSLKDNLGNETLYTYDDFGRLSIENYTDKKADNLIKTYSYDSRGNRSSLSVLGKENYTTAYSYNNANQLLGEITKKADKSSTETTTYKYDKSGNQILKIKSESKTARPAKSKLGIYEPGEASGVVYEENTYDEFNQLISTKRDGVNASYSYYPDGLRKSKTVNGTKTQFTWIGSNLNAEYDASGKMINHYIRGNGLIKTASDKYYLFNAHGDVAQLADSTGNITKKYDYDSFGNEVNADKNDTNPFRYCGEYFDKETQSVYLRARYYNPTTGRFITEDPIRANLNWYNYCDNNPIMFTDPSGLDHYLMYSTNGKKSSDFTKQAEYKQAQLAKESDTPIHMIEVNTLEEFEKAWESLGFDENGNEVKIDTVSLFFHGNERTLIMEEGTATEALSIDGLNRDGSAKIGDINKLSVKEMDALYLYSCNTGHLGAYSKNGINTASVFSTKVKQGSVYAYDGSVGFGPKFISRFTDTFGLYPRLSDKQENFYNINERLGLSRRDPKGEVRYYNGKYSPTYFPNTSIKAA